MPKNTIDVANWMANYRKRLSKPVAGKEMVMIPAPILSYNQTVFNYITGEIELHASGNNGKRPLKIDLSCVAGLTDDHIEKLTKYARMVAIDFSCADSVMFFPPVIVPPMSGAERQQQTEYLKKEREHKMSQEEKERRLREFQESETILESKTKRMIEKKYGLRGNGFTDR